MAGMNEPGPLPILAEESDEIVAILRAELARIREQQRREHPLADGLHDGFDAGSHRRARAYSTTRLR